MIYLCCKRIPSDLSLTEAADTVASFFVGDTNSAYLEKIRSRTSDSAKESLFAYSLLSGMIEKHFPCELCAHKHLVLARAENGKPYFVNSHLKFSISHSNCVVACALSDGDEVGVDIEASTFTPEKAQKLAARYFNQNEQKEVERNHNQFVRIWTQKEAASKLFGTNLSDYMQRSRENADLQEFLIHKFRYCKYPVTLCTKRDFGKIVLIGDNIE